MRTFPEHVAQSIYTVYNVEIDSVHPSLSNKGWNNDMGVQLNVLASHCVGRIAISFHLIISPFARVRASINLLLSKMLMRMCYI